MHKVSAPFAITKDNILTSANGQYTCRIGEDGKAIVRREADGAAVWQSAGGGVVLRLQEDGNLVLYRADDSVAWKIDTNKPRANPLLILSNNGRLILIGADLEEACGGETELEVDLAFWASPPVLAEDQIKALELKVSQEGVLAGGHKLKKGQTMRSKNGKFTLELADRGLVIKNSSGEPVWQPDLQAEGIPDHLAMQTDKNLVLYAADGKSLWAAKIPSGFNYEMRCVLEDDGDLVVFQSNKLEWSAGSAPGADRLHSGASLMKGQAKHSSNGQYALTLRQDGNLVLTDAAGKALWMTGLIAPEAERLVMQQDGNLVLVGANGAAIWASHTHNDTLGAKHGKTLSVRDDGTLNVSARSGGTAWNSGTWSADRLNPGQGLAPGMELKSPAGARLAVQEDGDVVLYCRHNHVRWSSGSKGKNIRGLCNRGDGRLSIYGKDGSELWGRAGGISLQLQDRPHGVALLLGTAAIVQDDRLVAGEQLRTGECLQSPDGKYELTIDNTGQLVVRRTNDQRVRCTNGVKTPESASLSVLADGNAVIYAKDGQTVLWASKTGGREGKHELVVTNEGTLQLHRMGPEPAIIWSLRWSRLFEGETFDAGELLVSPNGAYTLALKADGHLELARNADKAILWSTPVPNNPNRIFEPSYGFGMMNDGVLIVYYKDVRAGVEPYEGRVLLWASGSPKVIYGGHYDLALTDEGQLIVTRTSAPKRPLWRAPKKENAKNPVTIQRKKK